jgi:hypothetical protein
MAALEEEDQVQISVLKGGENDVHWVNGHGVLFPSCWQKGNLPGLEARISLAPVDLAPGVGPRTRGSELRELRR